jgi:hypothetical protein
MRKCRESPRFNSGASKIGKNCIGAVEDQGGAETKGEINAH